MALTDEDKKYLDEYEKMAQPKAMTNDDLMAQALIAIAPTLVGAMFQGYGGGAIGAGAGLKGLEKLEANRKAESENRNKFLLKRMDLENANAKEKNKRLWDMELAGFRGGLTAEEKRKDREFQTAKQKEDQAYQDKKLGKVQTYQSGENVKERDMRREIEKDKAIRERKKMAIAAEDRLDKKTTELSKRLEGDGLVELGSSLKDIDATMKTMGLSNGIYTDLENGKIDIPGWGASSVLEYIPFGLGRKAMSEEGATLRQKVDVLKNTLLKIRSGAAVTPPEFERAMKEIEGAKDDKGLMRGLQMFATAYNSKMDNAEAGTSPEAVNLYRQRGGNVERMQREAAPAIQDKKAILDALIKKKEAEAKRGR